MAFSEQEKNNILAYSVDELKEYMVGRRSKCKALISLFIENNITDKRKYLEVMYAGASWSGGFKYSINLQKIFELVPDITLEDLSETLSRWDLEYYILHPKVDINVEASVHTSGVFMNKFFECYKEKYLNRLSEIKNKKVTIYVNHYTPIESHYYILLAYCQDHKRLEGSGLFTYKSVCQIFYNFTYESISHHKDDRPWVFQEKNNYKQMLRFPSSQQLYSNVCKCLGESWVKWRLQYNSKLSARHKAYVRTNLAMLIDQGGIAIHV